MKNIFFFMIKRIFDIIFSFILIIIFIIPIILISLLILLTSRGNVIYSDLRVGKMEKPIKVFKFRTMYNDASDLNKYLTNEQIEQYNQERKVDNDPRITKVGKVLRKLSLDELPQLFNVFIGNMSFCGNRPISFDEFNSWFSPEERELLSKHKPGITGYWQISGRSNVTFKSGKRQELDLFYAKNYSIGLDLIIMLKTPFCILFNSGGAK